VPVLLPDWVAAVGVDDDEDGNECAPFDAVSAVILMANAAAAACCCDDVRFSMSSSDSDADEDREAPEAKAAASTEDSGASGARDTVEANAGAAARGGRREGALADIWAGRDRWFKCRRMERPVKVADATGARTQPDHWQIGFGAHSLPQTVCIRSATFQESKQCIRPIEDKPAAL
jgi:hypothetical protein